MGFYFAGKMKNQLFELRVLYFVFSSMDYFLCNRAQLDNIQDYFPYISGQ